MSKIVTAAEHLLKLAEELEVMASMNTVFACSHCEHTNTLQGINDAVRKYASSEGKTASDLATMLVAVDDKTKCPNCEQGVMAYQPTAESERYYVDGDTPEEKKAEELPKKDEEVVAGILPNDLHGMLSKVVTLGSAKAKAIMDEVHRMIEERAGAEGDSHSKGYHTVDPTTFDPNHPNHTLPPNPAEVKKGLEVLEKAHPESFGEKEASNILVKAVATAILAGLLSQAHAAGKSSAKDKMDMLNKAFNQVSHSLNMGAAPQNDLHPYQVKHFDENGKPVHVTVTPDGHGAPQSDTTQVVQKAAVDQVKLARYLG